MAVTVEIYNFSLNSQNSGFDFAIKLIIGFLIWFGKVDWTDNVRLFMMHEMSITKLNTVFQFPLTAISIVIYSKWMILMFDNIAMLEPFCSIKVWCRGIIRGDADNTASPWMVLRSNKCWSPKTLQTLIFDCVTNNYWSCKSENFHIQIDVQICYEMVSSYPKAYSFPLLKIEPSSYIYGSWKFLDTADGIYFSTTKVPGRLITIKKTPQPSALEV